MDPVSPLLRSEPEEWTLRRWLLRKAHSCGPSVITIVESTWVRAVMGALVNIERFLKLADLYSPTRLESASHRALSYRRCDYRTVQHILKTRLDCLPSDPCSDLDGQLLLWPSSAARQNKVLSNLAREKLAT